VKHLRATTGLALAVVFGGLGLVAGERGAPPASKPGSSVFVEELTWVEVRDAIKAGKTTVIMPTGGVEQSGPHMVLGKENFAMVYCAGEIARRLGNALVAPNLAYVPEGGLEPPSGHMRFAGSITLPQDPFVQVLVWAGRSFKVNGFTDVAFIGNSGGNMAGLKAAAEQLNKEWAGTGVRAHYINEYYEAAAAAQGGKPYDSPFDHWLLSKGEKPENIGNHAGIRDTSTLMGVEAATSSRGKLVRWDKIAPAAEGDGVSGNPTRASIEYGKKGLEMKIDAAVNQIKRLTARK
jgi:creatinine amidohydrolase/Fe(II)-dependent formamide hydrolase-like protein